MLGRLEDTGFARSCWWGASGRDGGETVGHSVEETNRKQRVLRKFAD